VTFTIKVPPVGESVVEATVTEWRNQEGDWVEANQVVVALDTEKTTLELSSPQAGYLRRILEKPGTTVPVGAVLCELEEGVAPVKPVETAPPPAPSPPVPPMGPAARRILDEKGVSPAQVQGSGKGGRILKEDAVVASAAPPPATVSEPEPKPKPTTVPGAGRPERVVKMTVLRKTLATRLKQVQNEAAILTTFNEVDMSAVMALRERYKEAFLKQHGVKLGFMSFFVKAVVEALKAYPVVNSEVRGDQMVFKEHYDVGVAVGGGKGLVVPVVVDADQKSFADLEKVIGDLGRRAQENKLKIEELQGGTFTISNGGVYGSLMSTPILNPPQTAILGMHKIQERPVGVGGQVVLRPMMYLALSYDHRAIDGREAVQFLVRVKELVEAPERLLLEV
jgi:2-oxoglutarate dehydrogenase E2 component (dihydrolipoamide succinyltransferase)